MLILPMAVMGRGWGAGMHPGMGYGPSWMGEWPTWLKLSNGQIRKLESIHETFLKEKELNALRAQFQEKAMESPLEGRKVLTPEQRAHVTAFFIGRGFGLHHGMEWMGSVYPLG